MTEDDYHLPQTLRDLRDYLTNMLTTIEKEPNNITEITENTALAICSRDDRVKMVKALLYSYYEQHDSS